MTRDALFAIATVLALVGTVLTGAAAAADSAGNATLSVDVTQDDDEVTVSVARNDTGVANVSVGVDSVGNTSYAGSGDYTTDDEGIVELPAPEENVTVEATAGTDGEAATAELVAAADGTEPAVDSFGLQVSSFVHELLGDGDRTGGIGAQVAAFVTANNPGNAPSNAGPPAWLVGDADGEGDADNNDEDDETEDGETEDDADEGTDDRRGPPDDAGSSSDTAPPADAGPPEDAGPPDGDENEGAEDEGENEGAESDRRGQPDDAGPPDEDDEETEYDEANDETDEAEDGEDAGDEDKEDAEDDESEEEEGEESEEEESEEDEQEEEDENERRGPPEDRGPG